MHLKADIKIDGNGYLVPMGSFKVYEVETVHKVTTLTCYDAMREADVLCPTEMQGEHNYIELWRLAATRLGLTPSAIDSDLGYNALATVDTQHTIRQVIEAIALACGGNAVVSGNALYVRPITSTADVTLTQWINQLEVASTPVEVTGVRVKKTFTSDGQEHTYFFGAGGYVIELNDDNLWMGIEGPSGSITVAAEAVAKTVYEQLKNKPIYKFSGDLPADPRLDIFDKVIVKDINGREYPSIITNYTFVFSGKTSVGNSVESSSSYNTSDSGPSGSSPSPGGGGGGTIDVDSALSTTSTNPVQNKVITAALSDKMDKAGGTFTGNVSGKYFTGTWLQTLEATDLGRAPGKIAVLDESGWVYYRTPAELKSDIGASGGGVDVSTVLDKVYPVGSIYMSVNSTNPKTLFGGTWVQIKDRFLLAAGTTYKAGATGGEAAHTLTASEMPSHNHAVYYPNAGAADHSAPGNYPDGPSDSTYYAIGSYTSSAGGGTAHNNMPPYLSVYVWKRTA